MNKDNDNANNCPASSHNEGEEANHPATPTVFVINEDEDSAFSRSCGEEKTVKDDGVLAAAEQPKAPNNTVYDEDGADDDDDNPDGDVESAEAQFDMAEQKKKLERVGFFEIFRYADRGDVVLMGFGTLGAIIGGAGMPAFSFALGRLMDDLLTADPETSAAESALIMVYIGCGVAVACMAHVACWCIAAVRQMGRVRRHYFSAVLRQEMGWHDAHNPGELTARMTGDTRVMQNGINDKLSHGIMNLFMGVFGFIFGFVFCWEETLVMLGIMPFIALCAIVFGAKMSKATVETRRQFARAGALATEICENIRTVQTFGKQDYELQRFAAAVKLAEAPGRRRELMSSLSMASTMCLVMITYTVVFFFCSYLIVWGRTTIGDAVATFLAVLFGSMGFGFFFPSLTAFTEARGAAYHLFRTIQRTPVIDIEVRGRPILDFHTAIEFKHVRFFYPTRPDCELFKDLCLTIHRGQKVAFSGASGCGKSSIIGLLQRFYDPVGGRVLVDGTDMKELDLFQWRDKIGIVSQEPNLFAGTMMDNVRVGKADATEEEVIEACKQANIHDTIMTLPDQYHTNVGAVGSQLSGGQKQRIAIARALVKRPAVLLLDEATSALDRKSEVEVQAALDKLMQRQHVTIIIIAHRLATIREVDTIYYVAHDGVHGSFIAEQGSFSELMARKGLFAAMATAQGAAAPAATSTTTLEGDEETHHSINEAHKPITTTTTTATEEDDHGADEPIYSGILSNEQLEVLDRAVPRTERQRVPLDQLAAWEVKRTKVTPARLLSLNRKYSWAMLLGLVGSLVAGATAPVNTIILGKMLGVLGTYDATHMADKMHKDTNTYAPLFIGVAAASFAGWMLQFFYGYAGERLTTAIRTLLFKQILRQDMSFFDIPGRDAGTLSGMLSGDCEAIHQLCGSSIGLKLQTGCTIVVGVIIAFCYQWKLAFIALACLPLILLAALLEQLLMGGLNEQKAGDSDDTVVTESLSNVRTVASFNLKQNREQLFAQLLHEQKRKRVRRNIIVGIIYGFSQFVYYGSFSLCYWYGGKLIKKGEADFEKVNVASLAILMGAMSAGEAGGFAAKMGDAQGAARRVFSVIDRVPDLDVEDPQRTETVDFHAALEPTHDEKMEKRVTSGVGCDVVLERTQFIYPARPNQVVLASVNLRFAPGTVNGLMGQTGCGKSTVVQLLACFYAHRRGKVVINGQALERLHIPAWRAHISVVLQEPDLFSGTIRDNIAYSILSRAATGGQAQSQKKKKQKNNSAAGVAPREPFLEDDEEEAAMTRPPTQEEIEQVARWACIHDDILAMPEGYDTQVGYKGRALSGGQKQRVAIARGLLRRGTKLLLLDEATSALDNATEARVQAGLAAYLAARSAAGEPVTVVSIAHRLTTIRYADQIVLLDGGKIKEKGNHETLMRLGKEYKTRWELYTAGMGQ